MSSEEIQKTIHGKLTIIRDILNSQYGIAGLVLAAFYVIGTLAPHEYVQLKDFLSHAVGELNNPIGVCVVVFLILVYINKSFFQKYLEKEKTYTRALKDFEAVMKSFSSGCEVVREDRQKEEETLQAQLTTINAVLGRFYSDFKEHEQYAVSVNDRVQMDLTPNIKRILTFIEGSQDEVSH